MNLEKEVLKLVKKIEGRLLIIGDESDKLGKAILNNKKLISCDFFSLNNKNNSKSKKSKGSINNSNVEQIELRKIYKKYKKRGLDYIICDLDVVKKEINYFIKNSMFLVNKKIFLYGNINDFDTDILIERYKKHDVNIELINKDEQYILEINIDNKKYKRIKSISLLYTYNIIDFVNKSIDTIGNIMVK